MKIVVGYDGSEGSKKALLKAKALISTCDVYKVTLIHVETPTTLDFVPFGGAVQIEDMEKVGAEVFGEDFQELREAARLFKNSEVDIKVIEGNDPAKVLADYAEKENYDLIVVGSRGSGGLNKLKPGSVSKAIVDNCCTSVMIVK